MNSAGTDRAARERTAGGPSAPGVAGQSRPQGRWAAAGARIAPAVIPAAVMAALGLWGLARDSSVGNDEAATRYAALLSLRQLAHLLRHVDTVHGTYYLLMHGWAAVGTSPAVLRIPSVIAMCVAVALTAVLAARLSQSGWAGLFAGLVMALTPVVSYYAQTARSYALVFACVVGATLALVAALDAETSHAALARVRRRWLRYALLIAVAGYLNEMSLLVLAAHAVTVLLGRYRTVVLRRWALAGAAGAALVAPLALISLRQHAAISWIGRPGPTDLRILFQDFVAVTPAAAAVLVACAIVAVLPGRPDRAGAAAADGAGPSAAAARAQPAKWWLQGGISLPSVAVPLLIVPALILFVESLVARPLFVDRYVLFGEAGAALLVGAGLYRIGRWLGTVTSRRNLVWLPGAIVCLAVLLLQIAPQQRIRTPQSRLFNFTGPARYIGANARPGDGVLFFDTFFRKDRLVYARDFANTSDFGQAASPQQAGTFRGTDKPFAILRPLLLERRRIWVVGMAPSPRLPATLLRQQSVALIRYFTLVRERRFKGIDVTLWVRRPGPASQGPAG